MTEEGRYTIFHNTYGTGLLICNDPNHPAYGQTFNPSIRGENPVETTHAYMELLDTLLNQFSPTTGEPFFVVNPATVARSWQRNSTSQATTTNIAPATPRTDDLPTLGTPLRADSIDIWLEALQGQLDKGAKTKGQKAVYVTDLQTRQTQEGKRYMVFVGGGREIKAYDNSTGADDENASWKNPFHPDKGWGLELGRELWQAATPQGTNFVTSLFIAIKENGEFINFQRVLKIVDSAE